MKKTFVFIFLITGMLFSCKKSAEMNATLNNGLVAYYPFNGNLNDQSGNNLNGIAVGNITYAPDKSGYTARSLQLKGDLSYVSIADNPKLNLTKEMTISLEFFPESTAQMSLVSKRTIDAGNQAFHVICNYQSPIAFSVIKGQRCNPSNVIEDWSTAFSNNSVGIKLNAWNCLVVIFNSTSQKIYLNGIKAADLPISFLTMGGCSGTDMRIGYWWNDDPDSFKGRIDEVRIYNRAITLEEMGKLCNIPNL